MHHRHLSTRFLLAGCLLVTTTVITGLWAALSFARLSAAADEALETSRARIDLTAGLAESLEREDDALLLALGGDRDQASRELGVERRRGDALYQQLVQVLPEEGEGHRLARKLRAEMEHYRAAGSELLSGAGRVNALENYHRQVNPLLRRAVATCGRVREQTFESLRQAGVRARDEAHRATHGVIGLSAVALVVASVVSTWLARSVVRPVGRMTDAVEALREGDFDRRVPVPSADELGRLAEGFNRLAERLAEYRASSLGELLAAKTTLEATLDALPDAVFVVAPDENLVALNPPAQAILAARGIAAATHLGQLPLRAEQLSAVRSALAGQACIPSRADFSKALDVTLDGVARRFLLAAVPVPEFLPRRHGAVIVLSDVTEFARLDGLRAELIGMASHELKTPLTTLQMSLRLLGEEANTLTPRQQEMLAAALGGCGELNDTIEELLDVTRIEAGRLRLDLTAVDLAVTVNQSLQILRPRFEDAQVQVRFMGGCPSAVVRGDALRLRTVLVNLLSNALKYSPPGGTVTVEISCRPKTEDKAADMVQVAVTDEGPGVPAKFRARIFEKFFRVEHYREEDETAVRGTGIGLYLCREILKAHGGPIHCTPGADGEGTRVAFQLPASALPD